MVEVVCYLFHHDTIAYVMAAILRGKCILALALHIGNPIYIYIYIGTLF